MMKLKTQLYALLLGITAALGGTSEAGSGPINNTVVQITPPLDTNNNPFLDRRNIRNVLSKNVSSNWAGATIINQENGVKSATATFTIPKNISLPPGYNSSKTYYFSAMIGIDGIEPCRTGSIQMGIDISLKEGDDAPWYEGWVYFYPANEELVVKWWTVRPGETVMLTITRMSDIYANFTFYNFDQRNRFEYQWTDVHNDQNLCGYAASWIVLDQEWAHKPLAQFGEFSFTDISWTDNAGVRGDLAGADYSSVGRVKPPEEECTTNEDSVRECHPKDDGDDTNDVTILIDCHKIRSESDGLTCSYSGPGSELKTEPAVVSRDEGAVVSKVITTDWAGASVIDKEWGVDTVTATIKVPLIEKPGNYSWLKDYRVMLGVVIDGREPCQNISNAMIGVGLEAVLTHGVITWSAWAEWHPGGLQYIPQLKIAQGDLITLNATRINHTAGIVYLKHEDTGEYLTLNLKQLAPGNALCGYSASWVVWDRFGEGYPLPYFDPIEFQNVGWRNKYGEWAAVGNATEISAQEVVNGPIVVDCVMSQPQGVNCTYGGPMDEDEFGPGEKNGGNDTRQA